MGFCHADHALNACELGLHSCSIPCLLMRMSTVPCYHLKTLTIHGLVSAASGRKPCFHKQKSLSRANIRPRHYH